MTPLLALFVEDNEDDTLLLSRELRRGGYDLVGDRVETPQAFLEALHQRDWHVILSDFMMPAFSGLQALALLRESGRDIPFILISGTVGEEIAVESIKAGATDYLMKNNLLRLTSAVTAALREADERKRRRLAESALRRNQELLTLIYDHSSDCLMLYTADQANVWRLASANRAQLAVAQRAGFVCDPQEFLGRSLEEVMRGVFQADDHVLKQLLHPEPIEGVVRPSWTLVQPIHLAGTRMTLEVLAAPVIEGAGTERHLLVTAKDITERILREEEQRRLEARLHQAERLEALGTLAGGIAHDFNNILTGMIGYCDLARAAAKGNEAVQDSLREILRAGQRAREMIRQILTFSRREPPLRGPVPLGDVIREVASLLQATLSNKVELILDLAHESPVVLADASQIHQVLMNLCTNALQAFGPEGGQLTISLAGVAVVEDFAKRTPPLREGPYARLGVVDNGPGMNAETLEHIFEPFFTTKSSGKSTGLGLAVVHGIVRNHDGAVTVASRPGGGTTFHVYLPLASASASTPAPPRKILFVDNEEHVGQMVQFLLERLGYNADIATDPLEALSRFRAEPYRWNAVITDLHMPARTGIDLAQEMLQIRPGLPMVLTTGSPGTLDQEKVRAFGFRGLLLKPFSLKSISDILKEVLS